MRTDTPKAPRSFDNPQERPDGTSREMQWSASSASGILLFYIKLDAASRINAVHNLTTSQPSMLGHCTTVVTYSEALLFVVQGSEL